MCRYPDRDHHTEAGRSISPSPPSGSRRDQHEARESEVRVERERASDPMARRKRKGDPTHQARAAADPAVVRQGPFVKRSIDHLHADRRQEIVHERNDRCRPKARPDQGDALDHHAGASRAGSSIRGPGAPRLKRRGWSPSVDLVDGIGDLLRTAGGVA